MMYSETQELAMRLMLMAGGIIGIVILTIVYMQYQKQYKDLQKFRRGLKRHDKVQVVGYSENVTVWSNHIDYIVIKNGAGFHCIRMSDVFEPMEEQEWEIV